MTFQFVKSLSTNVLLSISIVYLNLSLRLVDCAILRLGKPPPTALKPFFTSLPFNVSGPVSALANAPARCTDSDDWVRPSFIQDDCRAVVNTIFYGDVRNYGDIKLEFIGLGTDPPTKLPFMQTPRKYRYRSCIMAIVMNDLFGPGEVPGSPFPPRDVSNLREAFTAATDTLDRCVQRKRQAGWADIGKQ